MARHSYEYETSPRELLPEEIPTRRKIATEREKEQKKLQEEARRAQEERLKKLKNEKKKRIKLTIQIVMIFSVLVAISYRNSLINERFNEIQGLKAELASINKENEQLEVTINSSLNLTNIEKTASEKLGMQKKSSKQTIYVDLPKQDYVGAATEEIQIEEEKNWLQKIWDFIQNM